MPAPCGHPPYPDCPPQPAADAHQNAKNVLAWYHGLSDEHKHTVDHEWPKGDDGPISVDV